jgi:nucleoside-diphosphate-sugar epimerase
MSYDFQDHDPITVTDPTAFKKVLIVGGCGFVGSNLAKQLLLLGHKVMIYDKAPLSSDMQGFSVNGGVMYRRGDILEYDNLFGGLLDFGPDIVIHLASWGMSGSGMLNVKTCDDINVTGTRNLMLAMSHAEVHNLIYMSTYNVVYGGLAIENGDESMPYFTDEGGFQHTDAYSASKEKAEKLVLNFNGKMKFRTVSLRPAAIYGPGEERHFPRIVRLIDNGLFKFRIGSGALVDWVHIDNLVDALLLTIDSLLLSTSAHDKPCGEAYFISDGTPMSNFEFLKPVAQARLEEYPSIVIPVSIALAIAYLCELVHLVSKLLHMPIEPFMTRAEVYKVGRSHYFSIAKAKIHLGYNPITSSKEGMHEMKRYYAINCIRKDNADFFRIPNPMWIIAVMYGLYIFYCVTYLSEQQWEHTFIWTDILKTSRSIALMMFSNQQWMERGFIAAVVAHVAEALYAAYLSKIVLNCKPLISILWTLQTFALGFPSLTLLLQRVGHFNKAKNSTKDMT